MKRILCLCILLCCGGMLTAQNSIFDELARKAPQYGTVTIHQSAAIRKLVGANTAPADKPSSSDKADKSDSKSESSSSSTTSSTEKEPNNSEISVVEKTEGTAYRVLVYSGNNQRQSLQEAKTIERQIQRAFPKLNVFRRFQSPVWKVYVGHFATYEDALYIRNQLSKTFPSYRGMTIVKGDLPKSNSSSNK